MIYKSVTCPRCGAPLNVDEEANVFFCQYCGTRIVAEGDHFTYNKNETFHAIDDAKIKEAEVRRDIRFRELDQDEKEKKRTFAKWKIIVTLAVIGILAATIGGVLLHLKNGQDPQTEYEHQLEASGVQQETIEVNPEIEVSVATVQTAIKKAGELVTYKYLYTDIGDYQKDKKLLKKWSIPFTKDQTIFSYSGSISLGIETDEIEVKVDNDKKEIEVIVPKAKIISDLSHIDKDSFKSYNIKKSVFTETDLGEYQQLMSSLEESQINKLNEHPEIFKQAQEGAGNILNGLLYIYEEEADYTVSISYK